MERALTARCCFRFALLCVRRIQPDGSFLPFGKLRTVATPISKKALKPSGRGYHFGASSVLGCG